MTSAAFFLITRNLKNRVMRSVLRLRQPRYIVGAVLAGTYFWSVIFRKHAVTVMSMRQGPVNEFMMLIVSFVALLFIVGSWALPGDSPGLVFSEAEIQFFFAGPVSRRQLLAYKVLRSQVQSFFSAVIFSVFAMRGSHFLGMWVALAVLDVYTTFVSFARARLKQMHIGWWWRLAAVAVVIALIGWIGNRQFQDSSFNIPEAYGTPQAKAFMHAIATTAAVPPLGTILYAPRLFGTAVYSSAPALPIVILLASAFVFFFLTAQLDIAFEDASIVASQRSLARRSRMRGMRSGRSTAAINRIRPPFQLGATGRPEVAIIWKNLIGTLRMTPFPIIGIALPLVLAAVASIFGSHVAIAGAMGMMGLMIACMFVFFGPQALRGDLRTDMLRLDVIKTYPLSAEALLASELMAPLIVMSVFEMAMLLVSVFILQFGGGGVAFFTTPEFVVSAFVFVVPVLALQLLIQNGAIILFPAWSMSTEPNRGFSAMGQRFLFLIGNLLTLGIAVVPAAALFIPAYLLLHHSAIGILTATLLPVAVLIVEIVVAHKLLAAQFESLDIANDIDAAG